MHIMMIMCMYMCCVSAGPRLSAWSGDIPGQRQPRGGSHGTGGTPTESAVGTVLPTWKLGMAPCFIYSSIAYRVVKHHYNPI